MRPEDFNFENIDILEEELRRSQHVNRGLAGPATTSRLNLATTAEVMGRTATQHELPVARVNTPETGR